MRVLGLSSYVRVSEISWVFLFCFVFFFFLETHIIALINQATYSGFRMPDMSKVFGRFNEPYNCIKVPVFENDQPRSDLRLSGMSTGVVVKKGSVHDWVNVVYRYYLK